ncbi:MAG TPA: DsbA family protein [Candidatus Limnocylindrales bacterium]|nr:DsbA family protein [Candidatus Limnocylindrales bacterium]
MTSPVRVAIDFNCAASYLAVAPTRALESRLGAMFEWLPFPAVASTRPRMTVSNDDRSARHLRMRAEYVASELRRYAASRGLAIDDAHRSTDATAASLGLLWLRRRSRERAGEYVERVFDRIWRENAEADVDFVEKCLGPDADGFRAYVTGDGPRELDASREQLSSEGVWNVPAYLAGGELFIGRQHLPMVEWLATTQPRSLESTK